MCSHRTSLPLSGIDQRNSADALLARDFLETVTLSGAWLYLFAVIEHASRHIWILGTTAHPTASWIRFPEPQRQRARLTLCAGGSQAVRPDRLWVADSPMSRPSCAGRSPMYCPSRRGSG
jgi:hypothetical protein